MQHIQGWGILIMSLGIVAVAVQGIFRGWLPNGPKGYKEGSGVSRKSQPIGFWLFFCVYFGMGIYGAIYALKILADQP